MNISKVLFGKQMSIKNREIKTGDTCGYRYIIKEIVYVPTKKNIKTTYLIIYFCNNCILFQDILNNLRYSKNYVLLKCYLKIVKRNFLVHFSFILITMAA